MTRALAQLIEILMSCARYLGDDGLAAALLADARSIEAGADPAFDRIDPLFAADGPLHTVSRNQGWEEEFLGLAAAYRVETASIRP